MSMLKTLMEELKQDKKDLQEELRTEKRRADEFKEKVDGLERKIEKLEEWEMEKAKHEVRKEMEKSLIESDLKRTEAVAKLNTYIDMDTKDEKKHIQRMLEKAIDALGKQSVTIQSK